MAHRATAIAAQLSPCAASVHGQHSVDPGGNSIELLQFKDQVAAVTGAARGIGFALARSLAFAGCKGVVLADLDAKECQIAADQINSDTGRDVAFALAGDATNEAFAERLVQTTVERFGDLTILVNNAGYTWDGMLHTMKDDQWYAMLDIHLTAVFRLLRSAGAHMRERAKAEIAASANAKPTPRSIINISSTSGLHGNIGQGNYAAGKAGVVGLTKTAAKEWGPFGIRVNTVAFGLIDTRLTRAKETGATMSLSDGRKIPLGIPEKLRQDRAPCPLQRAGTAEEAAFGVMMLASPGSSYITGHTLEVTGGAGI